MPEVMAERFVRLRSAWIDLATGHQVQLRISPSGSRCDELNWNARCAALASLRHPVINALIDYGSIDRGHVFEAYEKQPPLILGKRAAQHALSHALRFVHGHGVQLARGDVDLMMRPIETGRSLSVRMLGVVLQHRAIFETVTEALDISSPGGACIISIQGPPQSGLRTTRQLSARVARLRGYVPIAPNTIGVFPWLHDSVSGRHVCVLGTLEWKRDASIGSLMTRLSLESARRHVVLLFERPQRESSSRAVFLERMGVTAMSGMVYVDSEQGPTPEEIFAAARAADGRPGNCLERLGAGAYEPAAPVHYVVHELSETYGRPLHGPARPAAAPVEERGTSRVVRRAVDRSESLVARGRHGAAERILSRAVRVHSGRGDLERAAETALRLGYLFLDRGHVDRAGVSFQQARTLSPASAVGTEAAIGLGLTWIDEGRLVDAEAVLRTTAATSGENESARFRASTALSRCWFWMGRLDEAMVALETGTADDPSG